MKALAPWTLVCFLVSVGAALGAEDHKVLQLVARILPRASLSLNQTQVTFVGLEDQRLIPAQEGPILVTAKGKASRGHPLTLTVRADADLEGPAGRIPIRQVGWNAAGPGLRNGLLALASDQSMGSWTNSGVHEGRISFFLKNDHYLVPGDYAAPITLTLSSP